MLLDGLNTSPLWDKKKLSGCPLLFSDFQFWPETLGKGLAKVGTANRHKVDIVQGQGQQVTNSPYR